MFEPFALVAVPHAAPPTNTLTMAKTKHTHSQILLVLLQCKEAVLDECLTVYSGNCTLNLTHMHGLYKAQATKQPDATAADQNVVTEAIRRALKQQGLDVKSDIKAAKGAKGKEGVTRYLSLGLVEARMEDARQHVTAALAPSDPAGLGQKLVEAGIRISQLEQEVAASKQAAAEAQNQAGGLHLQLFDVHAELTTEKKTRVIAELNVEQLRKERDAAWEQIGDLLGQVPGWEEVHIDDLHLQKDVQQEMMASHTSTVSYFNVIRQKHHDMVLGDKEYAESFGYIVNEDGTRERQPSGRIVRFAGHASDLIHNVLWRIATPQQVARQLPGCASCPNVISLTLLSGSDHEKPGLQAQYCSECGLRYNRRGICIEQHIEVCSQQFGVIPNRKE